MDAMGWSPRQTAEFLDVNKKSVLRFSSGYRPVTDGLADEMMSRYTDWCESVLDMADSLEEQADGEPVVLADWVTVDSYFSDNRTREPFLTHTEYKAFISAVFLVLSLRGIDVEVRWRDGEDVGLPWISGE